MRGLHLGKQLFRRTSVTAAIGMRRRKGNALRGGGIPAEIAVQLAGDLVTGHSGQKRVKSVRSHSHGLAFGWT
jgi:hypothetical protein